MKRTASEVLRDLEIRVAHLEKSAIFGRLKRYVDTTYRMNEEERQLAREEFAREKRYKKDHKEWVKTVREEHKEMIGNIKYGLSKEVGDFDVGIVRGNLSGVFSINGSDFEIVSELDEIKLGWPVEGRVKITGLDTPESIEVGWQYIEYKKRSPTRYWGSVVEDILERIS